MIIRKIGAVILNDCGQMLVVRKSGDGMRTFIIPGGKPDPGETDEDTCRRELMEELGVETIHLEYFGDFEEPSEFEDAMVKARIYSVRILGEPRPHSEIAELAWIDGGSRERGIALGSIISRHVLPRLIEERLVKPA